MATLRALRLVDLWRLAPLLLWRDGAPKQGFDDNRDTCLLFPEARGGEPRNTGYCPHGADAIFGYALTSTVVYERVEMGIGLPP